MINFFIQKVVPVLIFGMFLFTLIIVSSRSFLPSELLLPVS